VVLAAQARLSDALGMHQDDLADVAAIVMN
jgi:hypothetical protein